MRRVSVGELLYRQAEKLEEYLIVVSGWAAARITLPDGSSHIPDFLLPGSVLVPPPSDCDGQDHAAVCLTAVEVCPLPRASLEALALTSPELGLRLAELGNYREIRLRDHFASLGGRVAAERVAHLLVELFFRLRKRLPATAGERIATPLTLAHIGEATGLTRVHVSRVMTALREQHVCAFSRGGLEVLNPAELVRLAGFNADTAVFPG